MPPFVVTKASTLTRINEVVGRVDETFVPQIRELPGFAGYFLDRGRQRRPELDQPLRDPRAG